MQYLLYAVVMWCGSKGSPSYLSSLPLTVKPVSARMSVPVGRYSCFRPPGCDGGLQNGLHIGLMERHEVPDLEVIGADPLRGQVCYGLTNDAFGRAPANQGDIGVDRAKQLRRLQSLRSPSILRRPFIMRVRIAGLPLPSESAAPASSCSSLAATPVALSVPARRGAAPQSVRQNVYTALPGHRLASRAPRSMA